MAADYDEDDLLAELDELEQEELDKHLLEVISSTYFSSTHFSSTYFSLPFVACCSVRRDGSDSVVKNQLGYTFWAAAPVGDEVL